jgi:hypothetical protein
METNLVYVLRARGTWDEALTFAPGVLDAAWPEEHWLNFHIRAMELGVIFAERGDLTSLQAVLKRMRARPADSGSTSEQALALVAVALGGLERDPARVIAALPGIPTIDEDHDFDGRYATEYPNVARAVLAVSRPDLLDRFIASVASTAPLARTTRTVLEGYRAAGLGHHAEAVAALRSAGDQLAAWGFEPEAAHARQWQAASEIALGHPAVAIALLEAVRPVWQRLGARPAGEACERLLVAARQSAMTPAS